jgi:hypothetical protein
VRVAIAGLLTLALVGGAPSPATARGGYGDRDDGQSSESSTGPGVGGGIDPAIGEQGLIEQAWVGIEGSEILPAFLALDDTLTAEQQVLLGCGPFFGTRCDSSDVIRRGSDHAHRAIIILTWLTTSSSMPQPGLINVGTGEMFPVGAACTYYDETTGEFTTIPGCRGIETFEITDRETPGDPSSRPTRFRIRFEQGYLPSVDGCVFGRETNSDGELLDSDVPLAIAGVPVQVVDRHGAPIAVDLESEEIGYRGELGRQLAACAGDGSGDPPSFASSTRVLLDQLLQSGARTLWNPLPGCRTPGNLQSADRDRGPTAVHSLVGGDDGESCGLVLRDFVQKFENDPSSVGIFRSEGAALSFGLQMFLVAISCWDEPERVVGADPECFDPGRPYRTDGCSFAAPQLCAAVQDLSESSPRVAIDVEPNRDDDEDDVRYSRRRVRVAVLGSERVDVREIDVATLRFGPDAAEPMHDLERKWRYRRHLRDVNRDGFEDLMTHYRVWETGLEVGDVDACLRGVIDGRPFAACGSVRVTLSGDDDRDFERDD